MSGPGAIEKPTVFLSHAVTDAPIAKVLHDEINRIFANGVTVYASSVPGVVKPGEDWLESIRSNLYEAHAVIVVVTPVSINRPWIWFEVGASWSRMLEGRGHILPVCVPEIDKGDLPEPLGRLQAMSLGSASETRLVFQNLVDHFGFGNLKGYRHNNVKAKLPKYGELKVAESDLRSGTIYSGPYEGYTDDELAEVIDEVLVLPEWRRWERAYDPTWRSMFFTGSLVHFRALDEKLQLPPETSKRLLVEVTTGRYPAKVDQLTENTVRFRVDQAEYEHMQLQAELHE